MEQKSASSLSNKRTKKFLLKMLWLLFIPATYILVLLASEYPAEVERYYSSGIYPFIAHALLFQSFAHISFAEIIFLVAPFVLLACLIVFIVRLVRDKKDRLIRGLEAIQKVVIVCGVIYFLFYFLWGFNYSRLPYSEIADLPLRQSSTAELKDLCESLVERTNEARATLPSNRDNTLALSPTTSDLQKITRAAYDQARKDHIPGIENTLSAPKALWISPILSYTGITGIYIPFTAESNYNNDSPVPLIGATVCHELAHRQGFAREDEANFISYLVCTNSQNNYLNYSGLLLATIHSMNKLAERDPESYRELYALYTKEVIADLNADRAYWDAYSGEVEETVTRINDSYLKSNNLTDGVASYGRMVDLLLAHQRTLPVEDEEESLDN